MPDVVSNLFRSRGQIPGDRDSDSCHSVMCTSPPDRGSDYVSSLSVRPLCSLGFTIRMIIVTLLQSVLSGSSRQKFAPGSLCRKLCRAVRVVLLALVAARVQFDPGGPGFVTTLAYRALVPAQPQLDVIQLCPSSSRSGWSTLLSGTGMLLSAVSALLRWDFLCNFRAIERCGLAAHKGPLYGYYACVRCWYTKGHHAAIDGLLIDVGCLVVFLCCSGLSDRVLRCSGSVPDND